MDARTVRRHPTGDCGAYGEYEITGPAEVRRSWHIGGAYNARCNV